MACEGENTEPLYFAALKEYIESIEVWNPKLKITISPIPKIDLTEINVTIPHKTPRRKRELNNNAVRINPVIEDIHKAEPVRFVREAQIGIENKDFDEAWAIFDDDNRNYIKEAFDLSKESGKEVFVAYSSLCFEFWLLLHFERSLTVFKKSACRDGDMIIDCTTGNHEKDCYGSKCILGYLHKKGYISGTSKGKTSMFNITKDRLSIALHNSSWLKNYHSKNKVSNISYLKPYSNVDELVKRLLNIDDEIIWIEIGECYVVNNLKVLFKKEDDVVKIVITNNKQIIFIVRDEYSAVENENYEIINNGARFVLDPDNSCDISFEIHGKVNNKPKFISFKIGKTKLISEI